VSVNRPRKEGSVHKLIKQGSGMSRRAFLMRAAPVTGGVALVVGAPATAAAPTSLSPERRAAFGALVGVVGSVPGTLVEAGQAGPATSRLAAVYGTGDGALRARIDDALDSLDRIAGRPFASLDRGRALRLLLGSSRDVEDELERAIGLAAGVFHPDGFRWTRGSADVWMRTGRRLMTAGAG
jgi:hypothetical protein